MHVFPCPSLGEMNAFILSLLGAAAFAGICRELIKRPLVVLSGAGIIGYLQPNLPDDAIAQLHQAAAPTAPIIDTTQCKDEDAPECIIQENQRYSSQIVSLSAELERLFGPLYELAGELEDYQVELRS